MLHPGDGGDGGEVPEPAACETCDESARAAEAAATDCAQAAAAPGDGATASQPADRDGVEPAKRKRMRIRNGKSGDAR
eukprot:1146478-Prymnesium_polylepis.1